VAWKYTVAPITGGLTDEIAGDRTAPVAAPGSQSFTIEEGSTGKSICRRRPGSAPLEQAARSACLHPGKGDEE
jgi:hypothetical protein